jgi:hypothetical protein
VRSGGGSCGSCDSPLVVVRPAQTRDSSSAQARLLADEERELRAVVLVDGGSRAGSGVGGIV